MQLFLLFFTLFYYLDHNLTLVLIGSCFFLYTENVFAGFKY
jgi:hypothetical protein